MGELGRTAEIGVDLQGSVESCGELWIAYSVAVEVVGVSSVWDEIKRKCMDM